VPRSWGRGGGPAWPHHPPQHQVHLVACLPSDSTDQTDPWGFTRHLRSRCRLWCLRRAHNSAPAALASTLLRQAGAARVVWVLLLLVSQA
jgi:hypothetical protein